MMYYIFYIFNVENVVYSYFWNEEGEKMFSEYYKKRCLEFMSKELILVYYIFLIGIFGIYKNIKLSYV